MPEECKLVEHDGWLFIQNTYDGFNQPVRETFAYPTGIRASQWPDVLLHPEMKSAGYGGRYWDHDHRLWELEKAGETLPDPRYNTTEPIPFPGRAKQKRWYNGHWQKYTQAHGWENVY